MLSGDRNKEIFDRLLLKSQQHSAGNPNHQSIKTAIIASGGGMAGIFAAGVLYGLEQSGLSNAFDVAVGVSSGAASLAYFITQQAEIGKSIYTEDLSGDKFIKFQKGRPKLDIDYLIDIFRTQKPLNIQALQQNHTHLYATVTDIENCKPILLSTKTSKDVMGVIKASITMPIRYNLDTPININGRLYMDGAISAPIPFAQLMEVYEPTDVLIILNRPLNNLKMPLGFFKKMILNQYLGKLPPQVKENCLENHLIYNNSINSIISHNKSELRICVISPVLEIDGLTTNSTKLKLYFDHGIEQVTKILSAKKPETISLQN